MSFTAKQVEEALEEANDTEDAAYSNVWSGIAWEDHGFDTVEIDGEVLPFEVVKSKGGGEGQGEYCYVILKVGDQHFKKEGYYASHYGTDWDGSFFEVFPTEVTVTKYLTKKEVS